MIVQELIDELQQLSPEQKQLPVAYMDEVWLREVGTLYRGWSNEYGLQEDREHIRLDHVHQEGKGEVTSFRSSVRSRGGDVDSADATDRDHARPSTEGVDVAVSTPRQATGGRHVAHVHTFASLTAKPTTIAGYGITDLNAYITTARAMRPTLWERIYRWADEFVSDVSFALAEFHKH